MTLKVQYYVVATPHNHNFFLFFQVDDHGEAVVVATRIKIEIARKLFTTDT